MPKDMTNQPKSVQDEKGAKNTGLTLEDVRNTWEKGYNQVFPFWANNFELYVIGQHTHNTDRYDFLRYFKIGSSWEVSKDLTSVDLQAAVKETSTFFDGGRS